MKNLITSVLLSIALILSVLPATLATVTSTNPEDYFEKNYDMDLSIYSEPHWLDEHLSWDNAAHARIQTQGTDEYGNTKLRISFEDWNDASFDDVLFDVTANNNLITITRVSHNTAAPDPTSLELNFPEGTFLRVVEEERTYSGQDITLRLWDDVRQGESTRTIFIPRMVDNSCDAGTYSDGTKCVLGEDPNPSDIDVSVEGVYISGNSGTTIKPMRVSAKIAYEGTNGYVKTHILDNGELMQTKNLYLQGTGNQFFYFDLFTPTAGTHTYTVRLDPDNTLQESNEENNEKNSQTMLFEEEDDPTVGPDEYWMYAGDTAVIAGKSVTLNNVGSSGNVQVTVDSISKVVDNTGTTSVNGLDVTVKNYHYETSLEERWAVLHLVETDIPDPVNETVLDVSVRDIRIVPEQPEKGDTISVFVDARNQGTITHQVYVQTTLYETGTNRIIEKSSKDIRTLSANGGTGVYTLSHDLDTVVPGKSYYVKAYAGYVNDLPESNFNNNNYQRYFTVKSEGLPDLVGTTFGYGNPSNSNVYTFDATIKNQGVESSNPFVVQVLDNGVVRDTKTVPGLASGSSYQVTFTALALSYGYHNMKLSVDSYNAVQESNEYNNNVRTLGINVDVTNHYENRPTVTLTPIDNSVEEGQTGTYKLTIKDNHKNSITKKAYKYTLEKSIPFATNLPGFVWVNAGESKTLRFNVYTDNPVTNVQYSGSTSSVGPSTSGSSSGGSGGAVRDWITRSYNLRVSVIPELPQYRVSVFSTLYVREDYKPPNPPPFPSSSVTIELEEGWNLVSVPGKLVSFKSNTCSPKPVAFVYLESKKEYVTIKEAQRALGSKFSQYMSDHSFWVYSYEDCNMKANVKNSDENNLKIRKGWNFVPIKNAMIGKDLGQLTNGREVVAYWFDENRQSWSRLYNGEDFNTRHIGRGIVLRTNKAFTLEIDSDDSVPPSLPQTSDEVVQWIPDRCTFQAPFACEDAKLDDGFMKVKITQNTGADLTDVEVQVSGETVKLYNWEDGEDEWFAFNLADETTVMNEGYFSGDIHIEYTNERSGLTRQNTGMIRVSD